MTDEHFIPLDAETAAQWRRRIRRAWLHGDRLTATALAMEIADSPYSLATIHAQLLTPVLYQFGAQWQRERVTTAQIHVLVALAHAMLVLLYQRRVSRIDRELPLIMACPVPKNLHDLGIRMLADQLEEAHYPTVYLAPPTERTSLVNLIFTHRPACVAFSVTMPEQCTELDALAAELRERHYTGRIAAGGLVWLNTPGHSVTPHIDWMGYDVREFMRWLQEEGAW